MRTRAVLHALALAVLATIGTASAAPSALDLALAPGNELSGSLRLELSGPDAANARSIMDTDADGAISQAELDQAAGDLRGFLEDSLATSFRLGGHDATSARVEDLSIATRPGPIEGENVTFTASLGVELPASTLPAELEIRWGLSSEDLDLSLETDPTREIRGTSGFLTTELSAGGTRLVALQPSGSWSSVELAASAPPAPTPSPGATTPPPASTPPPSSPETPDRPTTSSAATPGLGALAVFAALALAVGRRERKR